MKFTPQQMMGAGRYSAKTRIGNWHEDGMMNEAKMKDYQEKRAKGKLQCSHRQKKMQLCNQSVPHSYAEDGILRFGMMVQLKHPNVDGTLASDPWDEVLFGSREFVVTLSKDLDATARNTFTIVKIHESMLKDVKADDYNADDEVHYGEPFMLECNRSLLLDERTQMLKNPLYLASKAKDDRNFAKGSHQQIVYMTAAKNGECIWKFVKVGGGAKAVLANNKPVMANEKVLMVHRNTNQQLNCCPKFTDITDFGTEYEVFCHTKRSASRNHQLVAEFSGRTTGDVHSGVDLPDNQWIVVTSDDPAKSVDNRNLPARMSPEQLLAKTREIVNTRGDHGIRGLARSFKIMDDMGDGQLDREDFKWGLYDYGIHLDDSQFDLLLDTFDKNGDGMISFDEFLVTIRGPMNERRKNLCMMAYDVLDKTGDGSVDMEDIKIAYDASQHPKVMSGETTEDEVLAEFMEQWDTGVKDGKVTREEFLEYYKDVSASVDDDDYFELMIRNAWHISGGEGWCANTSCRRVLVVHDDDSQEVVEIENDIGLQADDIEGMIQRLTQQGVTNIKRISLAD